jgi:glycosyltransferase involved in cell wall biosynthesis
MKARVQNTTQNNFVLNSSIVLSVGMIVKNEEKHLGACLEALKPLLAAVPSELVIVDTGSEDKTLEIALKHTNRLFHYEWNGDFGAARNFGLSKCSGEWFMFLDADDHFGDVSDMIAFFKDAEGNAKYNSAYYVTRNYTSPEHDVYLNLYNRRIARRTDSLRFEGAIHEYLTAEEPSCYLSSFAWHYGYAYESERARRKKDARNLELLERELAEKPGNIRTVTHILALSIVDFERKDKLIQEALAVISDDNNYNVALLHCAYMVYGEAGEHEAAYALLERTEKTVKPDNAILAEVCASRAVLLYRDKRYAEAIENINRYLEYYDKHEHGILDVSVFSCVTSNYLTPESRDELSGTLALCAEALGAEETYSALKTNTDLTDTLDKMSRELIEAHLKLIAADKPDLAEAALVYRDEQFFVASAKNLLFGVLLFEAALKCAGKRSFSAAETAALYTNYAKYVMTFTQNIYNPGLLNETDAGVLPENHRFGFYLGAAQKELGDGNKLGYIRKLKKALASCPSMTEVIKFMLEEFSAGL